MRLTRFLIAITVAACRVPDVEFTPLPDAAESEAIDATPPIDARAAAPGREVTAAGGRMTSPSYVFEVQLGHGIERRPSAGSAHRLQPQTVIKP